MSTEYVPIDDDEGCSGTSSLGISFDTDGGKILEDIEISRNGKEMTQDRNWSIQYMIGDVTEVKTSIGHCVSRDLHMGLGCAKQIKEKFGRIEELKEQKVEVCKG